MVNVRYKYFYCASIGVLLTFSTLVKAQSRAVELAQTVRALESAARIAEVPRELLIAICFVESSLRPSLPPRKDGTSHSYGLCQVKLETAQFMDSVYKHVNPITKERLSRPFLNAFYAAKYLKYQLKRYNGDWERAVDAYNKGAAVSSESKYVKKVRSAIKLHNSSLDLQAYNK